MRRLIWVVAMVVVGSAAGQGALPQIPGGTPVRVSLRDGQSVIEVIWVAAEPDSAVVQFLSEERTFRLAWGSIISVDRRRGPRATWGRVWPLVAPTIAEGSVVRIHLWNGSMLGPALWASGTPSAALAATLSAADGPAVTLGEIQAIQRRGSWSTPVQRLLGATLLGAVSGTVIASLAFWDECKLPSEFTVGECHALLAILGGAVGTGIGGSIGLVWALSTRRWSTAWP